MIGSHCQIDNAEPVSAPEAEAEALEENSTYEAPEVVQKRVVASRLRWPLFALVVAATACGRGCGRWRCKSWPTRWGCR